MREGSGRIKVAEGKKFEDASFPADHTSIDWDRQRNMTWKRPSEMESKPSLYGSKGVNPGAVRQGGLGDCWYLAAIAAVGEWPERIKTIFNGRSTYASDGQFVLNLYVYGKAQRVHIDDRLPMGGRNPAFAKKSPNGAWWGPLLEKGGAKYWGHYQRMSGGWMSEAFNMLVNQPTGGFNAKNMSPSAIWEKVVKMDKSHQIMSAACFKDGKEKYGLVTSHAYTIIGCGETGGKKYIKCRNPWGVEKYRGPMGDQDTAAWTAQAKKDLNHNPNTADGTFWVPLELYSQLFNGISSVNFRDDWKRDHKMAAWDRTSYRTIKHTISNPKTQMFSLSMQTPGDRMFQDRSCSAAERSESLVIRLKNT